MQSNHENANFPTYHKGEFFNSLSEAARVDLDSLIFPSAYPARSVLFCETQPANGIFIVLEGEVRLYINSSEGRRLSFRIARAGEVLGISAVVSGKAFEM